MAKGWYPGKNLFAHIEKQTAERQKNRTDRNEDDEEAKKAGYQSGIDPNAFKAEIIKYIGESTSNVFGSLNGGGSNLNNLFDDMGNLLGGDNSSTDNSKSNQQQMLMIIATVILVLVLLFKKK